MIERTVKIVAVLIVTALAIIGLLFDFRTSSGSLNAWGRIALALMLVSGIVAIVLEIWEYRKEKRSEWLSAEQQKEQRRALSDITDGGWLFCTPRQLAHSAAFWALYWNDTCE